jgi:hypothetical protein
VPARAEGRAVDDPQLPVDPADPVRSRDVDNVWIAEGPCGRLFAASFRLCDGGAVGSLRLIGPRDSAEKRPFRPGLISRVVDSADLVTDAPHQRTPDGPDAGLADAYRLVEGGLRQWFEMNLRAAGDLKLVPSILVHAAWQEFMLDSNSYSAFCASAIGYDLASVPALSAMPGEEYPYTTAALRRAYEAGLLVEGSKARDRVPLIFRVDSEAGLRDAVRWTWCFAPGDHTPCVAAADLICARHVLRPRRLVTGGYRGMSGGGGDGAGGWGDGGGGGGDGGGG